MELCLLLAQQTPQLGHQFLIVLLLFMVAVPSLLAFFAIRQHGQRRRYEEEAARMRAIAEADAERLRIEAENDRLRAALKAAQEETERIGRQLHDGVGYQVTLLRSELHLLKEYPEEFNAEVAAKLCDDMNLISSEIRDLSHTYSGHTFRTFGLVDAIEREIERIGKTSNLAIEVAIEGYKDGCLTYENTEHLYYMFLEAVQNVQKHANASKLVVSLSTENQQVCLNIYDDGCGFEPRQTIGLGLRNIEFRAIVAEGNAAILSVPGRGTTITISVPICLGETYA
ncbi:sensor histidine kinase [Parapedobacter deserti]|uniref:Sensor histidine kinase n=1 Tax=Parapedobacter deserti TaxID=1912957 RepID=A0ABV7JGP0_9SPHI